MRGFHYIFHVENIANIDIYQHFLIVYRDQNVDARTVRLLGIVLQQGHQQYV